MCGLFSRKKNKPPYLLKDRADLLEWFPTHQHSFSFKKFLCTTISKVYLCYFLQLPREKLTVFPYCEDYDTHTQVTCQVGHSCRYTAVGLGQAVGLQPLAWAHRGTRRQRQQTRRCVLALRTPPGCGHPRQIFANPGGSPPSSPPAALPVPRLPLPFSGPAGPGLPRASAGAAAARPGWGGGGGAAP